MEIKLSKGVKVIISQLNTFGFEAFAVGGCVRDSLMGLVPNDWDVCTNALPLQIKECFKGFNTFDSGIKHGTISVVYENDVYEVTTYRIDGKYTDNRHPESVTFTSDIALDLARRDFTVNAVAYNEKTGIVDPCGGIDDLKHRLIKCVGNPDERFNEDALRILRALRFASAYGFKIEEGTSSAIMRNSYLLKNIANERINSEFSKLLCAKYAERILNEYREVFAVFIPEIKPMFDFEQKNPHHSRDVWLHTTSAVANAANDVTVKLALFFHDIGKPHTFTLDENGVGHFYSHSKSSVLIADKILHRLKYPSKTIEDCLTLIKYHNYRVTGGKRQLKRLLNKIGKNNVSRLFSVQRADILAQSSLEIDEKLKSLKLTELLFDEIIAENECFSLSQLAVNGNDIKNLGIKEGTEVGKILNTLMNAVIDGKTENKKSALIRYASTIKKEDFEN